MLTLVLHEMRCSIPHENSKNWNII
jgi:hypothetical protein